MGYQDHDLGLPFFFRRWRTPNGASISQPIGLLAGTVFTCLGKSRNGVCTGDSKIAARNYLKIGGEGGVTQSSPPCFEKGAKKKKQNSAVAGNR